MTKKHFQNLAYALMQARPIGGDAEGEAAYAQWRHDVTAVSGACKQANPNFDADRFWHACDASKYTPAMHGR